nr:hypothetical protein Iba_chr12eCG7610 [Ipomoea batatas]
MALQQATTMLTQLVDGPQGGISTLSIRTDLPSLRWAERSNSQNVHSPRSTYLTPHGNIVNDGPQGGISTLPLRTDLPNLKWAERSSSHNAHSPRSTYLTPHGNIVNGKREKGTAALPLLPVVTALLGNMLRQRGELAAIATVEEFHRWKQRSPATGLRCSVRRCCHLDGVPPWSPLAERERGRKGGSRAPLLLRWRRRNGVLR